MHPPQHVLHIVVQNAVRTPLGAITLAGGITRSQGLAYQGLSRRTLDAYALVFTTEGRCPYWDAHTGARTLRAGDMLLLLPGVEHAYAPQPGERWDEHFLVFEGPVFDLWRAEGLLDPARPVLRAEPVPYWLSRLKACTEKAGRWGAAQAMHQVCLVQLLLADLLAQQAPGREGWLEHACQVLGDGLITPVDTRGLARSLGMSYDTLRRRFTEAVGMSPGRYRIVRCIDRACELLLQGQDSHQAIAARLGFFDEFHFSRRFSQVMGEPPGRYRRRVLG